jgi:hypothetical protein
MKIQDVHLQIIQTTFRDNASKIIEHFNYLKSPQCVRKPIDLEKRLRWDIINYVLGSKWICFFLYPYLNDDHIDTALREVMKQIRMEKDLAKLLS